MPKVNCNDNFFKVFLAFSVAVVSNHKFDYMFIIEYVAVRRHLMDFGLSGAVNYEIAISSLSGKSRMLRYVIGIFRNVRLSQGEIGSSDFLEVTFIILEIKGVFRTLSNISDLAFL